MNLRADHPPIYAKRSDSGMSLLAILMLATAIALWLIPLAMTLKANAGALEGIDGMIMSYGDGGYRFNWPLVQDCAARRWRILKATDPGGVNMLSPEWREYKHDSDTIIACRMALAARHEGWTAAAPDKSDPILPVPMTWGDSK